MEAVVDSKVLQFVDSLQKPEKVTKVRQQALDALNGMDFPTSKVEEWKYTRVAKYVKKEYHQTQRNIDSIDRYKIENLNAHQLVFINGFYAGNLSTIKSDDTAITIRDIEELEESYYADILEDQDENVFSLINKAYQTGGITLTVHKDQRAKYPIHLIHILKGESTIANARHFVHLESGAKAEIVTSFDSIDSENSASNIVLEGHLEENSNLSIQKLQTEEENVFHVATELFVQDKGSQFKMNNITTGAALTRNWLEVLVEGENCSTELNGVYLGIEKQHIDNHTIIDQLAANCTSHQLYKGVMDDQSTGVFNGRVVVRQDSQKITAYQSNKNILLSKKAKVNSKPELEIYADDVICSHGSTIGDLDEEALFYLQTRGISEEKGRHLLIAAFIGDVLDKVENEAVRKRIDQLFLEDFKWEF